MAQLQTFMIEKNSYLSREVRGFYRCDYLNYQKPNNPDYLVVLKNLKNNRPTEQLKEAINEVLLTLEDELTQILALFDPNKPIAICVVPRSKARDTYSPNQLLFLRIIKHMLKTLKNHRAYQHIIDGTDFLIRTVNTRTTHLSKSEFANYGGDGDMPYPGITKDTCDISAEIAGKQILLIDDIYTKTINIDEDVLQTLIDHGATDIMFFAIAKTKFKPKHDQKDDDDFPF